MLTRLISQLRTCAIAQDKTIVLMFHGIPPVARRPGELDRQQFEQQILFLKKRFRFLHPDEPDQENTPGILLTFDDGFCNNAEVVAPILRMHRVPALFFVTSRHCTAGEYVWFSYLAMLRQRFRWTTFRFRGRLLSMRSADRDATVDWLTRLLVDLKPHPNAMYQAITEELPPLEDFVDRETLRCHCDGLTAQQVAELAADPLFRVGAHTVDHPYLTRCAPEEAVRQIGRNKEWIEMVTGKPCRAISYPLGDYNEFVLQCCQRLGFSRGFAVYRRPKAIPGWETPRIGVYSGSLGRLALKTFCGRAMTSAAIIRAVRVFRQVVPTKSECYETSECPYHSPVSLNSTQGR